MRDRANRGGSMAATATKPWPNADLADAIHAANAATDSYVIREVSRRMAAQLPDMRGLDPGYVALNLSHALASLAAVADGLIGESMADLDDEERPEGVATLAGRLRACAADLKQIGGTP